MSGSDKIAQKQDSHNDQRQSNDEDSLQFTYAVCSVLLNLARTFVVGLIIALYKTNITKASAKEEGK